jgi:hypothetical protein
MVCWLSTLDPEWAIEEKRLLRATMALSLKHARMPGGGPFYASWRAGSGLISS